MSVGLKAAKYGVVAVVVAALIISASFLYLGGTTSLTKSGSNTTGTSTGQQSPAQLVIQLTDPPQVPDLTSSLNLTYTSLNLLVGVPSGHGDTLNTTTVSVNGSATLELLKLQNISETLGTVTLPNDSVIYSATFTVSSIKIDVNGTTSTVTLAGGGSTLTVTITNPRALSGTNVALLQLNPVVVQTPTGYQLIPSSVGVIRHSEGEGEGQFGSKHQLNENDTEALDNVSGNVTASLTAFSVTGNSTTFTVQVKNTGNISVVINAIGIHGEFNSTVGNCRGDDSHSCHEHSHPQEVVFEPVNGTISGTTCANLTLMQVSGGEGDPGGLTLGKGQCVNLTFSGVISPGQSDRALVPFTTAGEVYSVHVIASNGANLGLWCTIPAGPASCKVENPGQG